MLGTLITVTVINAWFLLPTVFLAFILFKVRNFYLAGGRSISRLEATSKQVNYYLFFYKHSLYCSLAESPVFTHVSSSMTGLTTIRAHQRCVIFNNKFHELQDLHTSACYLNLSTSTWYTVTNEWIYFFYQTCVIYTCTALRGCKLNCESINNIIIQQLVYRFVCRFKDITSSEAGLAISLATTLTGIVEYLMRLSVDVEKLMTSVERVVEYGENPSEGRLEYTDGILN